MNNHLHPSTLEKQYKDHLSSFRTWVKENDADALVYPENFGAHMSIDETSLSNGELYTILTNKDAHGKKGALAAIMKGTKNEVVTKALDRVPIAKKMAVQEITLDLANSMDWICRTNFMNATLTADRFHVTKAVLEGLQEMRIALRREAIDAENRRVLEGKERRKEERNTPPSSTAPPVSSSLSPPAPSLPLPKTLKNGDTLKQLLARSRYLLFKTSTKWTVSQKERADILFGLYPDLKHAYHLTLSFRSIFERDQSMAQGRAQLHDWYEQISASGLPELQSASCTIKANEGKILNFFTDRSTNAGAESFNAKLKGFRSLLRGVGDLKFFLFRVETLFA